MCSDSESRANCLFELGLLFAAEKDYRNALTTWEKALRVKPDYAAAWNNRGLALDDLGRKEEALMSYDKVLQIQSGFAGTYYNKACCYGLQEETDLALETLRQAIDLDAKYQDMAKTDPNFDRIRNDARFQALIEETNDRD
ncbi:TPR end-of-group domain-containing protein [Leptodesmis sp.]|uniref:TPR end-of-group domain-containing protein n=1 Tax=Leptodesmis sp. TaxID=3100501 RepID=UPI00405358B5